MKELVLLTLEEIITDFKKFAEKTYKYDHKGILISCTNSVEMYSYLRLKFGDQNGIYGHIHGDKKTDINNPLNWQYGFKYRQCHVYIYQHYRDLGIFSVSDLIEKFDTDAFLQELMDDIKFCKKEVVEIKKKFEQVSVIKNPYKSFYDLCDSTRKILETFKKAPLKVPKYPSNNLEYQNAVKEMEGISWHFSTLSSHSTILMCFTPIMIEAFIHLIFTLLAKNEVKEDKRLFDSFLKGGIDVKIKQLPLYCIGFKQNIINIPKDYFKKVQKVVNIRNDLLHGNLNYNSSLSLEEVFFDEKDIPLFANNFSTFDLMELYSLKNTDPDHAINLFEDAKLFINSVIENVDDKYVAEIRLMMDSYFLEYNSKTKILRKRLSDDFKEFVVI